ncbi:MAG: nucleotidyltransferase domain-containing protein [Clostridia bacterium]|nr:nucleotidyltransferase domain-containing protein [Clostridia bacterium]
MCTKNQLYTILERVAGEAKQRLGDRLDAVILFGSYARGDYDDESDVDIMIRIGCAPAELTQHEDFFAKLCSRLSLENDITVSVVCVSSEIFEKFKHALPFYANAEKEGVRVA